MQSVVEGCPGRIGSFSLVTFTFLSLSLFTFSGCSDPEQDRLDAIRADSLQAAEAERKVQDSIRVADSLLQAELQVAEEVYPEIRYTLLYIDSRITLDSIRTLYDYKKRNSDAHRTIATLNRQNFWHIVVGDSVVLPDTIVADLRAYAVFPQRYPAADSIPKLVLISNAMQAYGCYENGKLVRFAACNTGRESKPTLPGRYAMNWKDRLRISSLNEEWKLPFTWNFHLYAGMAFHEFDMPGRPVSHSCVRQMATDAEWLFGWGEAGKHDPTTKRIVPLTGTPVIILDVFDFSRKHGGPWRELASNREAKLTLPNDPMSVEEALIPISQIPTEVRGGLPNRQRYVYAEDTLRARGVIRPEARLSPSVNYNKRREEKLKQKQKKEEGKQQKQQNSASPTESKPAPVATPATKPTTALPKTEGE